MQKIIVESEVNERLDIYLSQKLNITRSAVKNLIQDKKILVNSKNVKAGFIVHESDLILIENIEKHELSASPEDIKLDIVYEDDDLLVINKPQGMVVHPAAGNYSGTLVNALTYHIKNLSSINGNFRPGIVHRLDKDTAGLLLVAKNDKAHLELARQIQTKECKRHYMAVLVGTPKEDSGEIITNISRSKKDRKKMDVCDATVGKEAITKYEVVAKLKGYSLVHFELKTGRTHQIRVHAKYIGHPVAGDKVYGIKNMDANLHGQLLCAYKICFTQPTTKRPITCEVDLPDYFKKFIAKHQ